MSFKILAQVEAPPAKEPTLLYQPPEGKVGIIGGIRIVSTWKKAEQLNMHLTADVGAGQYYLARSANQENITNLGLPKTDSSTGKTYVFERDYRQNSNNTQNPIVYHKFSTIGDANSVYTLSIFWVTVGSGKVTGMLVAPEQTKHLTLPGMVIDRDHPMKMHNGWLPNTNIPVGEYDQVLANHLKRCPHLVTTIWGQELDA